MSFCLTLVNVAPWRKLHLDRRHFLVEKIFRRFVLLFLTTIHTPVIQEVRLGFGSHTV